MIKIRLWPLIAKDVLKMVGAKWATIFPLSITGAIAFTNGDPMVPAYRLSLPCIRLFEPRNNERRFRLKLAMRDIVVWQRAVEGIQLGNKRHGDVISPRARVGIIVSTVIRGPIKVPATPVIGDGIIACSLFSNPKDGRYDVRFPRVTLDCRAGTGGDENLRFHFEEGLLPQSHRILGKVCRRRVGRSRLFVPEDFRGASNSQTETSRKKKLQNSGFRVQMNMGLPVFNEHLRHRVTRFNFAAHLLNSRFLLVQPRHESRRCFLLLSHGHFEIFTLLRHR